MQGIGRRAKYGEPLSVPLKSAVTPSQMEELRQAVGDGDVAAFVRDTVLARLSPASTSPDGVQPVRLLCPIPAGAPSEMVEYEGREIYCSLHPSGDKYAYVKVTGDSMDKVLPDGSYALVCDKWAFSGDVVAMEFTMPDGSVDITLKIFREGERSVRFEPSSTNENHKPMVLSETKPRGDVVWVKPDQAKRIGVWTGDYIVKKAG